MLKILVFGASNSQKSINKKLATYASKLLKNATTTILDLNDFEMPIYGIDKEEKHGIPEKAKQFSNLINDHDGILISLAEHNGNFTVAFKNITDWISRLEGKTWKDKKMVLLSTSTGGRGGANVMGIALKSFPYAGADIISHFSLPKFFVNFDDERGILDAELNEDFRKAMNTFEDAISEKVN